MVVTPCGCGAPRARKGTSKKGNPIYRTTCNRCHVAKYRPNMGYRLHKKPVCELCGFVPEHPCQLDVDHVDGDKSSSDPANLQTLCANCHRLKTYRNKDFVNKTKGT